MDFNLVLKVLSHVLKIRLETLVNNNLWWCIYCLNFLKSGNDEVLVLMDAHWFNAAVFFRDAFQDKAITDHICSLDIKILTGWVLTHYQRWFILIFHQTQEEKASCSLLNYSVGFDWCLQLSKSKRAFHRHAILEDLVSSKSENNRLLDLWTDCDLVQVVVDDSSWLAYLCFLNKLQEVDIGRVWCLVDTDLTIGVQDRQVQSWWNTA